MQNSQVFYNVSTSSSPISQTFGLTSVNITGLTNFAMYQFSITVVDVATGLMSPAVISGTIMPQIPGTFAPCGLAGNLWDTSGVGCTPPEFGRIINLNNYPSPYGLVNSAAAVPYCVAGNMNFFQFNTITPPANAINFTFVLNIRDSEIPAGVGIYWGTDAVNYPNFIGALIDPENGTTPYGDFNTYTFHFTTTRYVGNLSVALIGFNNPGFINFGESTLYANYNSSIVFTAPPPYIKPFPASVSTLLPGDSSVLLTLNVYSARSVYFLIGVLEYSQVVYSVNMSSSPVQNIFGATTVNVTGLMNFNTYQLTITVVDQATGLISSLVSTDEFMPAPPNATEPCGSIDNLWASTICTPNEFFAIVDLSIDPSPYGLVNSAAAYPYLNSLFLNTFQFPTVTPPTGAVNFNFILNLQDTQVPAGVGAYWGTDGVNYPNFIGSLIDPENGTLPGGFNSFIMHFTTKQYVANLSVALVGFNNPGFIRFGPTILKANFSSSFVITTPAPYLIPFPASILEAVPGNQYVQLSLNVYTVRPVYFLIGVRQNSQVLYTVNMSSNPVQNMFGVTSVNVTALTNFLSYQFTVTLVDQATGLKSLTVTSDSFTPTGPSTQPTTTTTTTTPTTTPAAGVPSTVTSSVSCSFALDGSQYANQQAVTDWANTELLISCANALSISQSWMTAVHVSVSNQNQQPASMPTHIRAQRLHQRSTAIGLAAATGSWLLAVEIVIDPIVIVGSQIITQQQVDDYANTLVSALNTAGSPLVTKLASQSVTVVSAELTKPSSSAFFSTAWHIAVVVVVVVVVLLVLVAAAVFVWKRCRTANMHGAAGVGTASAAGAKGVKGAKYSQQLDNERETLSNAVQSDEVEGHHDHEDHGAGLAGAEAGAMVTVEMTDMAGSSSSSESDSTSLTGTGKSKTKSKNKSKTKSSGNGHVEGKTGGAAAAAASSAALASVSTNDEIGETNDLADGMKSSDDE